jgi:peptide-methionine (S)-S-oxide reductase
MFPKRWFALVLVGALLLVGCNQQSLANNPTSDSLIESEEFAEATFAGGCFWCMEKPFDQLPGVIATTSGYTGGEKADPTYREVSSGGTGHAEAVRVIYDPEKVTYPQLLDVFWKNVDPLDESGQFCDRGTQYRTGIFYHDAAQKQQAEASKQDLTDAKILPKPIVTQITQVSDFFAAEDYHQNYYLTNPVRYKAYRYACGRDKRLKELWGES